MMRILTLAASLVLLSPAAALAQGHIVNRILGRTQAPPPLVGIDAMRADFLTKTGTDTILFGGDSALLSMPAKTTLAAQAQWLRQHPEIVVRIEGHADMVDTRDHALAIGARRAQEVRDYLVLMGVPAAQLTAVSMGKERPAGPGNARAVIVLVR